MDSELSVGYVSLVRLLEGATDDLDVPADTRRYLEDQRHDRTSCGTVGYKVTVSVSCGVRGTGEGRGKYMTNLHL
jgi:hypothetical protein